VTLGGVGEKVDALFPITFGEGMGETSRGVRVTRSIAGRILRRGGICSREWNEHAAWKDWERFRAGCQKKEIHHERSAGGGPVIGDKIRHQSIQKVR